MVMIMKTLNYNPMDKSTHGYDMLNDANVILVYGHPYSCGDCWEDCWTFCKLPDKSECDANGIPLARGIFGNMLIQMKIGKVKEIYGINCDNKTLTGIRNFISYYTSICSIENIRKCYSDAKPKFEDFDELSLSKVLEPIAIFKIVR